MARIKGGSFHAHHEYVWEALTDAMGALVAEHGYDGFTLGQVASRAGIARNTIYNYAEDKAALTAKIAQRASHDVLEHIEKISKRSDPAPERLAEIVAELMRSFETPTVRLMLHTAKSPVPQDVIEHPDSPFTQVGVAVQRVITDGVEEGSFRDFSDVRLVTELLSGIVRAAAENLVRDRTPTENLLPLAQNLMLNALRQR